MTAIIKGDFFRFYVSNNSCELPFMRKSGKTRGEAERKMLEWFQKEYGDGWEEKWFSVQKWFAYVDHDGEEEAEEKWF